MEYSIWFVPRDGEDPVEVVVRSRNDGRDASKACLQHAARVWETLDAGGARLMNAHPTSGARQKE